MAMFLLCNIHDRDYHTIYPDTPSVRFDISDVQLGNAKNSAWESIQPGAIVCVVRSSRNISTFCRVAKKFRTSVSDDAGGYQHVIVGPVVAKLVQDQDMTRWLNAYGVKNKYLPGNKFSTGFNVADLGDALDAVEVQTGEGLSTIGQLGAGVGT